jgi:Cell division protein SepF
MPSARTCGASPLAGESANSTTGPIPSPRTTGRPCCGPGLPPCRRLPPFACTWSCLIDFASGLTYALDGGMQRVADKVFLLTPRNVEVSAEERARLLERGGFFNQA